MSYNSRRGNRDRDDRGRGGGHGGDVEMANRGGGHHHAGGADPTTNSEAAWEELCGGGKKKWWGTGGCCCCVITLFLIIFLPISFSYVQRGELAFKKNTITNVVDRSTVYTNGRYWWGADHEPLAFPSIYQNITYRGNDLLVFAGSEDQNNSAAAGLEFGIEIDVYYRLTKDNLVPIFNDFGLVYHDRFVDAIKASIKNTAPEFGVDDYVDKRQQIASRMRDEVNNDIKDLHVQIEPHHLILLKVNFPATVLKKFEDTVIKDMEIDLSILTRDVDIYKKGTERLVSEIKANTTVVEQTADAKAQAITEKATAQAEAISLEAEAKAKAIILNAEAASVRIHEEALGGGLNNLTARLNITKLETRQKLFQILTIMDSESDHIILGDKESMLNIG